MRDKFCAAQGQAIMKFIVIMSIAGAVAIGGGIATGVGLSKTFRPDVTEYLTDEVKIDVDTAVRNYEAIKRSSKDYSKMEPDQAVQASFYLFSQEETNYSIGVGYSLASIVKQVITTRSVKDHTNYFEESNSTGIVNLYDRMFCSGDTTDTYWGGDADYGSHTKVTYSNDDYKAMMGRYISVGLVYVVAPETMLTDESKSGDPTSGITKTDDGYKIEIELDPIRGVTNYQKQMKTISNLAGYPSFDYCHLTIYTDADLNLKRFETHEQYLAVTSSGVGSKAEGRLTTEYYHNTLPDYGFPEPGSKLPDFPESL